MTGSAGDLVNTYAGAVLGTMLDDLANSIYHVCYPEYSSNIYGTPDITKAEAIILHLVTKYWNIIESLVKLKLSPKKGQQKTFQ